MMRYQMMFTVDAEYIEFEKPVIVNFIAHPNLCDSPRRSWFKQADNQYTFSFHSGTPGSVATYEVMAVEPGYIELRQPVSVKWLQIRDQNAKVLSITPGLQLTNQPRPLLFSMKPQFDHSKWFVGYMSD